MVSKPEIFTAGSLEAGQVCPCCQSAVSLGDRVGRCPRCQHLQHEACWSERGVCCSYLCEPATARSEQAGRRPDMVVTDADIAAARPAPRVVVAGAAVRLPSVAPQIPQHYSGLAITAFVTALAGIVLLGVPGLVAICLGAVAVGGINARRDLKGSGFAMAAIIIGALDLVGWAAAGTLFLLHYQELNPHSAVTESLTQQFDLDDLADAPQHIRQAVRANVKVESNSGLQSSEGSGVVIQASADRVFVLTNRHVVGGSAGVLDQADAGDIQVTFADSSQTPARLEWQAPEGVDIVVLSCDAVQGAFETAVVRASPALTVGESVFAIGNPLGLGWSYSRGAISAVRRYGSEHRLLRMIQAQLPLNPGNSGGGLYDEAGVLIGINTLTTAKSTSEGIGFAIAIFDLIPLLEEEASLVLAKGRPELVEAPDPE